MATEESDYHSKIAQLLEPVLPKDLEFQLIHVHSLPQKSRKLVFTSTADTRLDALITHYFVLTSHNVAILSLEIYTYESPDTFTIFVSKADTTGHYQGSAVLNMLHITQTLIRIILRFFAPVNKRVRISLFAKADKQYLFLGSVKNPAKHVLSDAELVKWWTKCLDGLYTDADHSQSFKAHVSIPGIDENKQAVARYFPSNAKLDWKSGDIFWEGSDPKEDELAWAVKRIPRFPDDPKSRFLDSIVAENRAKKLTKKQFWLELQSRQEFRLGKSVGIIGVELAVSPQLHHDFSKSSALNKKETRRFKDLLLSLNFETLQSTEIATKRLLRGTDDAYIFELKGSGPILPRSKRQTPVSTVTTLNAGLVRKKQKK